MKLDRLLLMIAYLGITSNFSYFPFPLNILLSWGAVLAAGVRKLIRSVMMALPGPSGQNLSLVLGVILVPASFVLYLWLLKRLNTVVARKKSSRLPLIPVGMHAAGTLVAFLIMPKETLEISIFSPFVFLFFMAGAIFYIFLDWRLACREAASS